eukprot:TRINITY_DN78280_c0_g1_i1.p2 TRINITY_DN78280_c0_g1~~TRINITY_DN78280_c0_g1_i1.p2  ORF type:complete len:122 (+),score=20.94 TRINITY_DN78280_c0_g1_i1:48-368(+)
MEKPVPHVHLLAEAGQPLGLSAKVTTWAASFLANIALLPPGHICAQLAVLAAEHSTWSSAAAELLTELGLPTVLQWCGGSRPVDAKEAKKMRPIPARSCQTCSAGL